MRRALVAVLRADERHELARAARPRAARRGRRAFGSRRVVADATQARTYTRRIGELILLTGASGYVGGRLLRALEERGETHPLPFASPRGPASPRRSGYRGRRRRRPRPADDPRRARRGSHRLLPRPLDELEPPVRRGRPRSGARVRRRRRRTPVSGRSSTSAGSGTGAGSRATCVRARRSARSCARRACRRSSCAPRS